MTNSDVATILRLVLHKQILNNREKAAVSNCIDLLDALAPPKDWRAKWPEHEGCLIHRHDTIETVDSEFCHGKKLYTGAHKLNMIPHDGGPAPVNDDQMVFVFLAYGNYFGGERAVTYSWTDVVAYCPIDPVRVDI